MEKDKVNYFREKITSKIKVFQEKIIELKEVTKPIAPDVAIGRN